MKYFLQYSAANCISITLLQAILFLGFAFAPGLTYGQSISGKNKVYLIGQVTNNVNGGPVKFQEVFISSDTVYEPQFSYYKKVLTDQEGYYYDTIYTFNTKGAFLISTIDYLSVQHDTMVYYRFTWGSDNILFPNFVIPIKPIPIFYQANFYYVRNPGGENEQEYQFYDITNAENIISWFWEFGDGATSVVQHPNHVYNQIGLFRVILTVQIQDSPNSQPYLTQMVKVINVTAKEYFHFGGHVFAGMFPIDYGEAFLYKIEENNLVPIDTAMFSSQFGYYCFYQLIEGEYIVKADLAPNSGLYNQFMTTYYSDKLHWINADTVYHHTSGFDYHINMVPNNKAMSGPGVISGKITYGAGVKENMPACNMSIFLYNLEDMPVGFIHSDDDGYFALAGLDLGSYLLYAEVTGKNTIPLLITLDEFNHQVNQVELTIELVGVVGSVQYAGISSYESLRGISQAYPNPASDYVSLDLLLSQKTSVTWSLIDQSGRLLSTNTWIGEPGVNPLTLDISGLSSGLYFIAVHHSYGRVVTRKFIK